MTLVFLDWVFLKNFNMKKNQGIAHLASIFILPILVIGIFYAPAWLKILLGLIFIVVAYFIWKNVLKK